MLTENIIFQIESTNYPKVFPRKELYLGRILYVKIIKNDIEIKQTNFSDAEKYAIIWIATSNWTIFLVKSHQEKEQFILALSVVLEGYISKSDIKEKLTLLSKELRPEHLFKTKEFENSKLGKIHATFERLNFIRILKKEDVSKGLIFYWEPLCIYHLLTCFDLLGQPTPWLTFDAWLKSESFFKRRDEYEKHLSNKTDLVNSAQELYLLYSIEYGVKNSFHNFINEILPLPVRNKLLSSVKFIVNKYPPFSETIEHSNEEEVIKYLFQYRNNYTHKARVIEGASDFYIPKDNISWRRQPRQEFKAHEWTTIMTQGWPNVIEDAVKIGLTKYINQTK